MNNAKGAPKRWRQKTPFTPLTSTRAARIGAYVNVRHHDSPGTSRNPKGEQRGLQNRLMATDINTLCANQEAGRGRAMAADIYIKVYINIYIYIYIYRARPRRRPRTHNGNRYNYMARTRRRPRTHHGNRKIHCAQSRRLAEDALWDPRAPQ